MLNYKTFLECGCKDKNLFLNKKINKVILTKFENHKEINNSINKEMIYF